MAAVCSKPLKFESHPVRTQALDRPQQHEIEAPRKVLLEHLGDVRAEAGTGCRPTRLVPPNSELLQGCALRHGELMEAAEEALQISCEKVIGLRGVTEKCVVVVFDIGHQIRFSCACERRRNSLLHSCG